MEYITLGNLENLYDKLISTHDKSLISQKFNEPAISTFKNYLSVIREVRNSCAHGNVIVDMSLTSCVQSGAACPTLPIGSQNTFYGAIRVIDFMLRQVSVNRSRDMWNEIHQATHTLYTKAPSLQPFVERKTGILLSSTTTKTAGNTTIIHKISKIIAKLLPNSK